MTTNEKPLSVSLFAFNNRIVSIKPIIKKSKVLVIRKLTRQINVLKNKKGNEKQITKNQRKAQKIKDEINLIKKLKFNDIAIYCMENETTFDQVIKSKPNIDLNEKSLAKISLHKLIVNEINKLKESEKDWKKILIQYKSRIEKKRSWKEKQKFHKELEESLAKIQATEVKDEDEDSKEEPKTDENVKEDCKEEVIKKKKIEKKKDIADVNNSQSENDTMDDDDDDDDISIDIDMNDENEEESENEDESDKEPVQANGVENESKKSDTEPIPTKKRKKEMINPINMEIKTNYKPRVNTNSKEMVIKQIVLDELSNLDEIPINTNNSEDNSEKANDITTKTTTTAISDPFFLSANGGAHIVDTSNARVDDSIHDNYDDDDFNDKRYKNYHLKSSFTNLSRDNSNQKYDGYRKRFDKYENGKNNDYYDRRNNRQSDNDFRQNRFKNDDQNGYKKFDKTKSRQPERFNEKPKPEEDIANLHPSWKAKKEQEEKLKSLKFQGTKVKFDDDDAAVVDNNNKKTFVPKTKPKEDTSNLHPSWKAKKEQEEKLKALKFQGTKLKFDDDD